MKLKYQPTKIQTLLHREKARQRRLETILTRLDYENLAMYGEPVGQTLKIKSYYQFNIWLSLKHYLQQLMP